MINTIPYLPLDPSKSLIPSLWLGTWSLGGEGFGQHDLRHSREVISHAFENGVAHFDTAGFYAHGKSEALLDSELSSVRKQVFYSTKGGIHWSGRHVVHDGSPTRLRQTLMESLDRLNTDYLDLYQLHWPDPKTSITESIQSLQSFQKEGLIRYWGVGNLSSETLKRELPDAQRIPHQVHFNPIHHDLETLQAGHENQRCLNCVISPLEQGLLSGSSPEIDALGKGDVRRRNPYYKTPSIRPLLQALQDACDVHPLSLLVLLWILGHPTVDVVIPGPRKRSQLETLLTLPDFIQEHGFLDNWHAALETTFGQESLSLLQSLQQHVTVSK
tara:strand:+ start:1068 stop:2054 length:987 start_codon:yes stop_codon:yes gene_type:complete